MLTTEAITWRWWPYSSPSSIASAIESMMIVSTCFDVRGLGVGIEDVQTKATRKDAGLCCGSRLRKGEVFAYVGLPQNLKDLKKAITIGRHK